MCIRTRIRTTHHEPPSTLSSQLSQVVAALQQAGQGHARQQAVQRDTAQGLDSQRQQLAEANLGLQQRVRAAEADSEGRRLQAQRCEEAREEAVEAVRAELAEKERQMMAWQKQLASMARW